MVLSQNSLMSNAEVDRLNKMVFSLLDSFDSYGVEASAVIALACVRRIEGLFLIKSREKHALCQTSDGVYVIITYKSVLGDAAQIYDAGEFEKAAIGFDNNPALWPWEEQ